MFDEKSRFAVFEIINCNNQVFGWGKMAFKDSCGISGISNRGTNPSATILSIIRTQEIKTSMQHVIKNCNQTCVSWQHVEV